MTYVEKMALKVWDYHDMVGCEEMVNQIIADTKRACKKIVNDARGEPTDLRSIAARIDFVEVKEQEE